MNARDHFGEVSRLMYGARALIPHEEQVGRDDVAAALGLVERAQVALELARRDLTVMLAGDQAGPSGLRPSERPPLALALQSMPADLAEAVRAHHAAELLEVDPDDADALDIVGGVRVTVRRRDYWYPKGEIGKVHAGNGEVIVTVGANMGHELELSNLAETVTTIRELPGPLRAAAATAWARRAEV